MLSMNSRPGPPRRIWLALVMVGAVGLAACGDDESSADTTSAQEQYCEAVSSLQSDVTSLRDVDVLAEGTDAFESALQTIRDDLSALRDSADDAAADDVDALSEAVDELASSLADLGDDLNVENAGTVATAVGNVVSSAQAVFGTLSDCE